MYKKCVFFEKKKKSKNPNFSKNSILFIHFIYYHFYYLYLKIHLIHHLKYHLPLFILCTKKKKKNHIKKSLFSQNIKKKKNKCLT